MKHQTAHDSETPAHGQQVITACAFLHHDFAGVTKVFLPKRAETKKFLPGVYELPGGHIEHGEDIVDGLTREIREEFGMPISVGEPFAAFTYLNEVKGSHSIEVIFLAQFADNIENIKIDPADHSGFKWIGADELSKVLSVNKTETDPEIQAMKRGFTVLKQATIS